MPMPCLAAVSGDAEHLTQRVETSRLASGDAVDEAPLELVSGVKLGSGRRTTRTRRMVLPARTASATVSSQP